jgi:dephospho-CoA kinase
VEPPVPAEPFVVAITGGIASGKSLVSQRFEALGVHVYDADVAAREVVAPGTPGLQQVADTFGDDVILPYGRLDRRALRMKVFADPGARRRLEAIVHPLVGTWLRERVADDDGPYVMLAIPLLAETWPRFDWVDRVLVIDAPDTSRIERLIARDGIDATLARQMLEAQAPREQRLALADDVIDNGGHEAELEPQVERLHARYLELATVKRDGTR